MDHLTASSVVFTFGQLKAILIFNALSEYRLDCAPLTTEVYSLSYRRVFSSNLMNACNERTLIRFHYVIERKINNKLQLFISAFFYFRALTRVIFEQV